MKNFRFLFFNFDFILTHLEFILIHLEQVTAEILSVEKISPDRFKQIILLFNL